MLRTLPLLPVLLVLVLGETAVAKDFEEEARVRESEALVLRVSTHREAKDRPALEKVLAEIPAAHNALKTKTAQKQLQKAVGALLGDDEQKIMVRKAAVDTLAAMFDEKGVWAQLKKFVPKIKTEAVGQLGLSVLGALAKIQADGAIKALQNLSKSGRDPAAAGLAVLALGKYSYSKKREAILKFLIAEMTRMRPGRSRDVRGRINAERFNALRDKLVLAANTLTRRDIAGIEPWLVTYKEMKKTPEKLFRTQR